MSTANSSSTPQPSGSPRQTATGSSPSSTSPPTSLTFISTNTTPAQSVDSSAGAGPSSLPALHATLPSAETQRHIAEARRAVVASIGNLVDSELQSRASILHENAAALDMQEKDLVTETANLRREREKLALEADMAAKKLKEVGNVQNWAEVLERQFVVLEETLRLADEGSVSGSGSGSGSSVCSCSDCGREDAMDVDEELQPDMNNELTSMATGETGESSQAAEASSSI